MKETERFWAKARKSEGCWLWVGAGKAYGVFYLRRGKPVYAHRYSAFLSGMVASPNAEDGAKGNDLVRHDCDTPRCVRPDHLRVGSAADNVNDMVSRGRHADQSGALNGNAKLSPADVEKIRQLYAAGAKQAALAKRFGVSQGHISGIVTRAKWR